jgi:hypothetical protein
MREKSIMAFENMNETELREFAKKRVEAKKEFRIHLFMYGIINFGLFMIYVITTGFDGYPWFVWSLLGWGIGLAAHYFTMKSSLKGDAEMEIEKEIEIMKRK